MDNTEKKEQLVVIWSAPDPEIARNLVFMYTENAMIQGWWDEVCLVVWGPSAKLLAEDSSLQSDIQKVAEAGVTLEACKACANNYGVADVLTEIGINVIYMGAPLTKYLKEGRKVLSF